MINMVNELNEAIENSGHTNDDIDWCAVGLLDNGEYGGEERPKVQTYTHVVLEYDSVVYDDGYGSQRLFGVVVFKDGTWLERGEYDGSEWWEFKSTPNMKDYVLTTNKDV